MPTLQADVPVGFLADWTPFPEPQAGVTQALPFHIWVVSIVRVSDIDFVPPGPVQEKLAVHVPDVRVVGSEPELGPVNEGEKEQPFES